MIKKIIAYVDKKARKRIKENLRVSVPEIVYTDELQSISISILCDLKIEEINKTIKLDDDFTMNGKFDDEIVIIERWKANPEKEDSSPSFFSKLKQGGVIR